MGSLDITHDGTPDCRPVSWAWMRPHIPDLTTERTFYLQAMWVINAFGLCF